MKGSIQIARIAKIPVLIHWSFSFILLYVLYYGEGGERTVWLGLFILAMFFCVILHEYGHALTARHYGVDTKHIVLLPIGGLAMLERLPEKPIQEFFVAIAGPMVNFVIAILLLPYLYFYQDSFQLMELNAAAFIPNLIVLNVVLAVFNLVPAFPMDGGRIFRALLSIKFGRGLATTIAARFGQLLALGFVVFGIYSGDYMLPFLGLFIFVMATQEEQSVKVEELLKNHTVAEIVRPDFTKYTIELAMKLPIERNSNSDEKDFLIFDAWQQNVVGVLPNEFIKNAIKEKRYEEEIGAFLSDNFEQITPETSLKDVFEKIQTEGYSIMPVMEEGQLIGVVARKDLGDFIQQKLKRK